MARPSPSRRRPTRGRPPDLRGTPRPAGRPRGHRTRIAPAHRPSEPGQAAPDGHRRRTSTTATRAVSTGRCSPACSTGRWVARAPERPDHRPDRRRQDLPRLRAGQPSLPPRAPRPLLQRLPRLLRGPHPRPRRRPLRQAPGPARQGPTCWSSTTGAWPSSTPSAGATCWRSSMTATDAARPSSPASSRSPTGTTPSATRRSPTPSSTASSIHAAQQLQLSGESMRKQRKTLTTKSDSE